MKTIDRFKWKRLWLWVLLTTFAFAISSSMSGCSSSATTAANPGTTPSSASITTAAASGTTAAAKTPSETEPIITFANTVIKNQSGITTVIGEAINRDSKARSFTLKVSFYDKDKKLLGTAVGAVNKINGGETKVFSAIATGDYSKADSIKVQVDTMLGTSENAKSPIIFSNIIKKAQAGMTMVDGEVKNTDTKPHSFTVVVAFYGKDKQLLGTAAGAVNDLAAGDTKTFSAIATGDYSNAASVIAQVDTLLN